MATTTQTNAGAVVVALDQIHVPGNVRGPEVQAAVSPLHVSQEHARDALAPGNGPCREPPLKHHVLAVLHEQTINRPRRRLRMWRRDADLAQILQRPLQA